MCKNTSAYSPNTHCGHPQGPQLILNILPCNLFRNPATAQWHLISEL